MYIIKYLLSITIREKPSTRALNRKSPRVSPLVDSVICEDLPVNQWPTDWSLYPYPLTTQQMGTQWLQTGQALVLRVPSAAVPAGLERIAVINPQHPHCQQIRLVTTTADLYNKRTFQGL